MTVPLVLVVGLLFLLSGLIVNAIQTPIRVLFSVKRHPIFPHPFALEKARPATAQSTPRYMNAPATPTKSVCGGRRERPAGVLAEEVVICSALPPHDQLQREKGNECDFRHSEGARMNPRDCWYWLNGNCLNPKCSFRHPPIDGMFGAPTPGIPAISSHYAAYNSGQQMVPSYYAI